MNRLFLVDTENTNDYSFVKELFLDPGDCVYLLYSNHSKNVPIDFIRALFDFGGTIEFLRVSNGKPDELDFQLCTLLGTLVNKFKGSVDSYHLVTNDSGFASSVSMLRALYPNVKVYLHNTDVYVNKLIVSEVLKDFNLDRQQIGRICCCIHNSSDLQSLHCNLKSEFPSLISEIYPIIKKNLNSIVSEKPNTVEASILDSSLTLFNGDDLDLPRPVPKFNILLNGDFKLEGLSRTQLVDKVLDYSPSTSYGVDENS